MTCQLFDRRAAGGRAGRRRSAGGDEGHRKVRPRPRPVARPGESWSRRLEYRTDLFTRQHETRLLGHFTTFLQAALAQPDGQSRVAAVDRRGAQLVRATWKTRGAPRIPADSCTSASASHGAAPNAPAVSTNTVNGRISSSISALERDRGGTLAHGVQPHHVWACAWSDPCRSSPRCWASGKPAPHTCRWIPAYPEARRRLMRPTAMSA